MSMWFISENSFACAVECSCPLDSDLGSFSLQAFMLRGDISSLDSAFLLRRLPLFCILSSLPLQVTTGGRESRWAFGTEASVRGWNPGSVKCYIMPAVLLGRCDSIRQVFSTWPRGKGTFREYFSKYSNIFPSNSSLDLSLEIVSQNLSLFQKVETLKISSLLFLIPSLSD